MRIEDERLEVRRLHREVDERVAPLERLHRGRLRCSLGCSDCCVDGLTVFEVEAERIRVKYGDLLRTGAPHPEGACAFLDPDGACRIYDARPYVCRTQGLPLRWLEQRDGATVELRDICPLNAVGTPIEDLEPAACWEIGPIEEKLAALQRTGKRVALRSLFAPDSTPLPD